MIKTFADQRTRDLLTTGQAKRFPADVARRAARKLEYVHLATWWRICFRFLDGDAGVSRQSVNELLGGRRAVSPEMALRLGRLFGNSPEFWLNARAYS